MSSSLSLTSSTTLKSGYVLPLLGFGVWASPQSQTVQSCLTALATGYRHIDTAQIYANEAEVGQAVRESGLKRQEVFLTSKIMRPEGDDAATYEKCLESVKRVGGEDGYLDLFLVHNVMSGAAGVRRLWGALERLVDEGRCRSIGVSNMGIAMIEGMKEYAKVWPPHVNQLELHPWCQQREIVEYCRKNGIVVEAYCPLVRNQKAEDPTLKGIAEGHGKSTAQVLIRYCLQKGWTPLPKSDNPGRIRQNADVFDFVLSEDDLMRLDAQDQGRDGALVVAVDNGRKI